MRNKAFIGLLMLGCLAWARGAGAVDITICWTHAPCADVTHYRVYQGTASGVYDSWTDVGYVDRATLGGFSYDVPYFFSVTAVGPAGESAHANEVSIRKPAPSTDTDLPLVLITSPAHGEKVTRGELVMITVAASDLVGVLSVEVDVNGKTICAGLTQEPYQCAWPVPNAKKKSFMLEARADDAAGHQGTSPPVTVTSQ